MRRPWPASPARGAGPGSLGRLLRRLDPRPIPAVLVDPEWYRLQEPRAPRGTRAARWHFALVGDRKGLSPHPLIDPSCLASEPDGVRGAPRRHVHNYLTDPTRWDQRTHHLFDGKSYRERYPDVAASRWNPLVHFLTTGEREGRRLDIGLDQALLAIQYRDDGIAVRSPLGKYAADTSTMGESARLRGVLLKARDERILASHSESRVMPASDHSDIHVVVLASGDAPLLDACLDSIAAQTVHARVTVVTHKLSRDARATLGTWVGVRETRGRTLAEAWRAGLAGAHPHKPSALAVVDATVTLDSRALERAELALTSYSAGAVVGKSLRRDGLIDNAGYHYQPDGVLLPYQARHPRESSPTMHARHVDCGGGELAIYNVACLEQLSLEDEWGPATTLEAHSRVCAELESSGWPTWYCPDVRGTVTRMNGSGLLATHTDYALDRAAHGRAARRRGTLFVDQLLPVPSHGSGYPRANALVASVARVSSRHVTVYALDEAPGVPWEELRELSRSGVECHTAGGREGLESFLHENHDRFDTLVVARPSALECVLALRDARPELFERTRLVYDSEAIAANRERTRDQLRAGANHGAYALQLARELSPARHADAVFAASEPEARIMLDSGLTHVHVYRHAVEVPASVPDASTRSGIVFMGRLLEESSPNVDSVRWFLDECLPLLRVDREVSFTVIGRVTAELAAEFETRGATVVGGVPDVSAALQSARVMVAPTRFAAGIPVKVPTAAAHGTPVVVTPLLREQLGWTDGLELAVGDGPRSFASAVAALLDDDALWNRIHAGARNRVQEEYSMAALDAIVERVLLQK